MTVPHHRAGRTPEHRPPNRSTKSIPKRNMKVEASWVFPGCSPCGGPDRAGACLRRTGGPAATSVLLSSWGASSFLLLSTNTRQAGWPHAQRRCPCREPGTNQPESPDLGFSGPLCVCDSLLGPPRRAGSSKLQSQLGQAQNLSAGALPSVLGPSDPGVPHPRALPGVCAFPTCSTLFDPRMEDGRGKKG